MIIIDRIIHHATSIYIRVQCRHGSVRTAGMPDAISENGEKLIAKVKLMARSVKNKNRV